MINLLNLVPQDSTTKGWGVEVTPVKGKEHIPNLRNYAIVLNGSEGVRIGIDRSKYNNLVAYDDNDNMVIDRNVPISIYSIYLGADKYLPIVTTAKSREEDIMLLMLNFETDLGSVISSVELENFITISYLVKNKDFRTKLSLSGIGVDRYKESSITIKYGFNNGRTLLINKINIPPAIITPGYNKETKMTLDTNQEIVDKITLGKIELPRMDLSTICVNNREGQ